MIALLRKTLSFCLFSRQLCKRWSLALFNKVWPACYRRAFFFSLRKSATRTSFGRCLLWSVWNTLVKRSARGSVNERLCSSKRVSSVWCQIYWVLALKLSYSLLIYRLARTIDHTGDSTRDSPETLSGLVETLHL